MTVIKRVFCISFILLVLSNCTPEEHAAWLQWKEIDPTAADEYAESLKVTQSYGVCGEWHDLAISVGFTEEQWPTVNRLMYRESHCNPSAYNRSGASGLMQIMPMWADDCGGSRSDLFDPTFNLRCAVHVLNVQGWTAWSTY